MSVKNVAQAETLERDQTLLAFDDVPDEAAA